MTAIKKLFYFIKKTNFRYYFSKLLSHIKLWISKRFYLFPPTTLMMEPTNHCNLKCPLCPTGLGTLNREKRTMTLDEFKKVIDDTHKYVKEIILWNYGEPFINKNILPMIRYAADHKIYVITSTNGHFFHDDSYCEEIVRSGLHRMILAIDGATQDTYEKFRRSGNLEKVLAGTKRMVAAKKRLKSKIPYIELQFIMMKHNEHQLEDMRKLAEDLEVDLFIEKPVGIHSSDKRIFSLKDQFLATGQEDNYKINDKGEIEIVGDMPNDCDWPYKNVVINADGVVVVCCQDINSVHTMGNIYQENLLNIWNNDKYKAFRKQLRTNRRELDICKNCPAHVKFSPNNADSKKEDSENVVIEEFARS